MQYALRAQNGDSIAVPQLVFERLAGAEEGSLRVALYILATGVTDPEKIAADLRLRSRQTAESALAWWAGAGLLSQRDENTSAEAAAPPPAPMTWQEIAAASRTDPMVASLVECAQNSFGRSLSHSDLQKLVGLYVQEGYHPETILLCVSYLAGKGRRTLGAVVHELKAWQAAGVTTGEEADAYLQVLALREKREALVASLLKMDAADLTLGGKKAIARWYEAYGFDETMVREAVLQAGSKADIWYLNGILKSWHAKGQRSVHDVRGSGAVTGEGRNVRVDRSRDAAPAATSGAGLLQNAMDRPRRLKRKD